MKTWSIVAEGVARELYNVDAETEEEAREKFNDGNDLRGPYMTETSDLEIIEIEEA